jgi:diacylglycerol kinase family enzyme
LSALHIRIVVIFRLRKLFNGTIYTIGHVQYAQGQKVRIESSPETPLEIDGELLGATPIEFNVRHREVRVIVNKSFLDEANRRHSRLK